MGMLLEHFHKYCSHAGEERKEAVFLVFGFVSARSQAAAGMLLCQSLAKKSKILAPQWLEYFFKRSYFKKPPARPRRGI
jgi:hypothetical protein